MRNGNLLPYFSEILWKHRSYPTYEEWKLVNENQGSPSLWCSYPTYEEWKQGWEYEEYITTQGSYPTYEEWKPNS